MSKKTIASRKFLEKQVKLMLEQKPKSITPDIGDFASDMGDAVTAVPKMIGQGFDIAVGTGKEIGKGLGKSLEKSVRDHKIINFKIQGLIRTSLVNRDDELPYLAEIKAFLTLFNDYKAVDVAPVAQDIDLDDDDDTPLLDKKGAYTNIRSYNKNKRIINILTGPWRTQAFNQRMKSADLRGDTSPMFRKSRNEVYQEYLDKLTKSIELFEKTLRNSPEGEIEIWFEPPGKNLVIAAARYNWSLDATASRCLKLLNFYIKQGEMEFNPENTLDQNLKAIKSIFTQRVKNTPQMMDSWWKFVSASIFDPTGVYGIEKFGALYQAGLDAKPQGIEDMAYMLIKLIAEEEVARKLAMYIASQVVPGKKNAIKLIGWVVVLFYLIIGFYDILGIFKDAAGVKAAKNELKKAENILKTIVEEKRDATREENVAVTNILNQIISFAGEKILKIVNTKVGTPEYPQWLAVHYYLTYRINELSKLTQDITKGNAKEIYDKLTEADKILGDTEKKNEDNWINFVEDVYLTLESNHEKQDKQIIIEQSTGDKFSKGEMEKDIEAFLDKYKEKMVHEEYKELKTYQDIMKDYKITNKASFQKALKRKNKTLPKTAKIVNNTPEFSTEESLSYYKKLWARFWSKNIQTYSRKLSVGKQKYKKQMKLFDISETSTAKKNGVAYRPISSKLLGKIIIPVAFAGPIQIDSGEKYNSFFFFHTHPDDSLQKIYDTGLDPTKFPDQEVRIQSIKDATFWNDSKIKKYYIETKSSTKDAIEYGQLKTELENMRNFYYKPGDGTKAPVVGKYWSETRTVGQIGSYEKSDYEQLEESAPSTKLAQQVEGSRRISGLLYVKLIAAQAGGAVTSASPSITTRVTEIVDKDLELTDKLKQIDNSLDAGENVEQNTQEFINISAEKINNFLKIVKLENDMR